MAVAPARPSGIGGPKSAVIAPAKTEQPEAPRSNAPVDAMGAAVPRSKIDTAGALKQEEPARGRATRIEGDWLGRERAADVGTLLVEARAKLCPGESPQWVGPPQRAPVAKAGMGPPIGLSDGFLDPKASYEDNLARVAKHGVERYAKLSRTERWHEQAFAMRFQTNPTHFVAGAELLAERDEVPTYTVDKQKRQYPAYGSKKAPKDETQRNLRLLMNHALHPTATAIAQLAFLKKLDELAKLPKGDPRRQIFVTGGGCSVGKGSLCETAERLQGKLKVGAIWDAAGEGEARENPWLLEACEARGLKAIFGYAVADPLTRYEDVLTRSEESGRLTDVLTFARSYTEGAKNMKAFLGSPAFKRAAQKGIATAMIVETGPRDPNVPKKTFSNARVLASGKVSPDALPSPPPARDIVQSALGRLEKHAADRERLKLPTKELLEAAVGVLARLDAKALEPT
jgi:hypothetical protein